MNIQTILEQAVSEHASDVFIVAGLPVSVRKNGVIHQVNEEKLLPSDTESLLKEIYELADHRDIHIFEENGDDDFAFALTGISRFRVCAYKQRGRSEEHTSELQSPS